MFGLFNKEQSKEQEAVKQYIDILNKNSALTDNQVMMKMSARSISEPLAWEVIGLFPVFAGRELMSGLGIQFSKEYTVLDANGKTKRSGILNSHPVFKSIKNQINTLNKPEAFESVAFRSAELNAVNQALNDGADPRDLISAKITLLAFKA